MMGRQQNGPRRPLFVGSLVESMLAELQEHVGWVFVVLQRLHGWQVAGSETSRSPYTAPTRTPKKQSPTGWAGLRR